jgi:hypothetical protein
MTRTLPSKSDILDSNLRARVLEELDEDLSQLRVLLGHDLACWNLAPQQASATLTKKRG